MWNKILGLTDEDVIGESNLSVLDEWYAKLQASINRELVENDVENASELPDSCRKKVRYWLLFLKLIRKRSSQVKQEIALEKGITLSQKERRAQRGIKYAFYAVCKKELPGEEFDRLMRLAEKRLMLMNNHERLDTDEEDI